MREPDERTMQTLTRRRARPPVGDRRQATGRRARAQKQTRRLPDRHSPTADSALWHVLGHGGLRPGEALALTRDDVLAVGVRVSKALVHGLTGEPWRIEKPKTPTSRRVVDLPPDTMTILRAHLAEQDAERRAAGARYVDHGFLFANATGSPCNLKNLTMRAFRPLLTAARLPTIRLYDLRHTHVSLMLAAGVPLHVVSARVGHASARG